MTARAAPPRRRAAELYDLLVLPAVDAVGTPKTPSGAVRYVPFEALWDGGGWFVEKVDVVKVTALDRRSSPTDSLRGRRTRW